MKDVGDIPIDPALLEEEGGEVEEVYNEEDAEGAEEEEVEDDEEHEEIMRGDQIYDDQGLYEDPYEVRRSLQ